MPSEMRANITQTPQDVERVERVADTDPERFRKRDGATNVSAVYRHALAVTVGDEERADDGGGGLVGGAES